MNSQSAFKVVLALIALSALVITWALYRSYFGRGPIDPSWFESNELTVVAYPSFVSGFGPGPELAKAFERRCGCEVKLVNGGDTGVLIQRVALRPDRMGADVIIGLDQFALHEARELLSWELLSGADTVAWLETLKDRVEPEFWPYDWAPMTLLYRESEGDLSHIRSWQELGEQLSPRSIALQDPRTSHPGLQFLYWQWSLAGGDSDPEGAFGSHLRRLAPLVHSQSPGWSQSYGLFQRRQTRLTFSYFTSLSFHRQVEEDYDIQALQLDVPHPYQVEYMGVPSSCTQCDLAQDFVRFLMEPEAQKIIMEKNFMLPVVESVEMEGAFGDVFERVSSLSLLSREEEEAFLIMRESLEQIWSQVFRQR